jgi:hypothetical protein
MIEDEDVSRFIEEHLPQALAIAGRLGFAVERPAGEQCSPEERRRKIRSRLTQASGALTQLGQWLDDDDELVRMAARDAIHKCLQIAYTGDRPEMAHGIMERFFIRVDRLVSRFLQRFIHPDQAEPRWTQPPQLRKFRLLGIASALIAAVIATAALWGHFPMVAVVAVCCMAVVDGLEGSFARVMGMRDAQVRWYSCVASHVGDLLVMLGMSAYLYAEGLFSFAYLMLLVAIVSSVGSMVRVSSLQAGQRFWRSSTERVVRFTSAVGFASAASFGFAKAGCVVVASALSSYAFYEIVRTVRRVDYLSVTRGGFIFFSDAGATCWAFEDEEDAQPELALFERSAPSAEAVLGSPRR